MRSQQPFEPSDDARPAEANLGDVGRAVRTHWRWIAIPAALAFVGSLLFVTLVPPRYTGEARLLLQTGDSYFTRPTGDRSEQAPQIDEQAVASQVQVVMSRDLARQAIQRLGLVGNAEFDPEVGGPGLLRSVAIMLGLAKDPSKSPPEDRVLENYYDRLLVYPVGKSRIVAVEFRSRDPELAAKGANTVAELYLESQEGAKKDQARSASTWLGGNIDSLRTRVTEAEAKVEAFRSKSGLLAGSGTTTISAQQLSELSTQLAQARTAQSDAQVKAKLIRDLLKEGRAFEIPDVSNNELVRRLQEQRVNLKAQLALELRTLLPQHPRIKELNAQLTDLETQIRASGDRIAKTLENDARIAGGRVDSLNAALDAQKKVVATANEGEVQLRALEREARIQREQLESYLGRYREATARDTEYGASPDARIVSRAIVPQIPSFPKKLPIVALATLAAAILALGVILARVLLGAGASPKAAPRHEAESDAAVVAEDVAPPRPVLALLSASPVLRGRYPEPAFEDVEEANDQDRYDFGLLIERLGRAETDGRGRCVLVTCVETPDAALQVAEGLAGTLAAGGGRVILASVEADETEPVDAAPGLTDLVAGEAAFSDVMRRDTALNVDRIATGTLVNDALFENPEGVAVVMDALSATYDWIFFALRGADTEALLKVFSPEVDTIVISSDLDAADPRLVAAYERARSTGATDVVVAREQATAVDAEAA